MERDALGESSCSKSKAPFPFFCTHLSVWLAAKLQMWVDVVIAPVLGVWWGWGAFSCGSWGSNVRAPQLPFILFASKLQLVSPSLHLPLLVVTRHQYKSP